MSDNNYSPKENVEQLPLVAVTEIRDIQMVALQVQAPEGRNDELKVQLQIGKAEFKAREGELFIRISALVECFDVSTSEIDYEPGDEQRDTSEDDPVAFIKATYLLQLELDPRIDPASISADKVSDLVEGNIIFMLYPYIRSTVHRLSGEMPFPPIVLPYMRR